MSELRELLNREIQNNYMIFGELDSVVELTLFCGRDIEDYIVLTVDPKIVIYHRDSCNIINTWKSEYGSDEYKIETINSADALCTSIVIKEKKSNSNIYKITYANGKNLDITLNSIGDNLVHNVSIKPDKIEDEDQDILIIDCDNITREKVNQNENLIKITRNNVSEVITQDTAGFVLKILFPGTKGPAIVRMDQVFVDDSYAEELSARLNRNMDIDATDYYSNNIDAPRTIYEKTVNINPKMENMKVASTNMKLDIAMNTLGNQEIEFDENKEVIRYYNPDNHILYEDNFNGDNSTVTTSFIGNNNTKYKLYEFINKKDDSGHIEEVSSYSEFDHIISDKEEISEDSEILSEIKEFCPDIFSDDYLASIISLDDMPIPKDKKYYIYSILNPGIGTNPKYIVAIDFRINVEDPNYTASFYCTFNNIIYDEFVHTFVEQSCEDFYASYDAIYSDGNILSIGKRSTRKVCIKDITMTTTTNTSSIRNYGESKLIISELDNIRTLDYYSPLLTSVSNRPIQATECKPEIKLIGDGTIYPKNGGDHFYYRDTFGVPKLYKLIDR